MLLAIDTASRWISLALHDGHQLYYESTWPTTNNHTIELAPGIQYALAQTKITVADLTAVAVSQGPGSFTGLRIGLSMAKGLAMAQLIALVAIPTLDVVATGVPALEGRLVAVLQAGRGRICAQPYEHTGECWKQTGPAVITTWEKQLERIEQPTLLAGEVDETGRSLSATRNRPVKIVPGALALRRAGFLAEIAWSRLRNNDLDDPATVVPIYLHQPGVPNP